MMARHCAVVFIALAVCYSGLAYSDNTPQTTCRRWGPPAARCRRDLPAPLYKKWLENTEAAFGRAAEL